MKHIAVAGLLAAMLAGCAAPGQVGYDAGAAFDREVAAMLEQVQAGTMTEKQLAERAAVSARVHFPNDYQLHALRDYKIVLAERLERGEITQAEFDVEWRSRHAALMAERRQLGQQIAAQERAANAAATAQFLNNVGNSFRRAAPVAPVTCTSMPLGYSISTTCR